MALQLRKSGQSTWTTATPGGVLYRSPGTNTWTTATSIKVQIGGAWVDSGYVAYPEPATNLRAETPGTGDTKDPLTGYRVLTVAWNAPVAAPAPTHYRLTVVGTNNNFVPMDILLPATTLSYTINFGSGATAGNEYKVKVVSLYNGLFKPGNVHPEKTAKLGAASYTVNNMGYTSGVNWVSLDVHDSKNNWGGLYPQLAGDSNDATYWASSGYYSDSASDSYTGIQGTTLFRIGPDPVYNKPRQLNGLRATMWHGGGVYLGYYRQDYGWFGGIYAPEGSGGWVTATPYMKYYDPGTWYWDGNYSYFPSSETGINSTSLGTTWEDFRLIFAPPLPYDAEAAVWGVPYRPRVYEFQVGFKSWGVVSTTTVPATANTFV